MRGWSTYTRVKRRRRQTAFCRPLRSPTIMETAPMTAGRMGRTLEASFQRGKAAGWCCLGPLRIGGFLYAESTPVFECRNRRTWKRWTEVRMEWHIDALIQDRKWRTMGLVCESECDWNAGGSPSIDSPLTSELINSNVWSWQAFTIVIVIFWLCSQICRAPFQVRRSRTSS